MSYEIDLKQMKEMLETYISGQEGSIVKKDIVDLVKEQLKDNPEAKDTARELLGYASEFLTSLGYKDQGEVYNK